MKCDTCRKEMRFIKGQPTGVEIYQCDICRRIQGE